jgi:hypothetical protein
VSGKGGGYKSGAEQHEGEGWFSQVILFIHNMDDLLGGYLV